MKPIAIQVNDIRAGDRFLVDGVTCWTAVADAETYNEANDSTIVEVRYPDGGTSERIWDVPTEIEIVPSD